MRAQVAVVAVGSRYLVQRNRAPARTRKWSRSTFSTKEIFKMTIIRRLVNHANKPSLLIRWSAIMFFLITIGHMSGYPWATTDTPEGLQLISSMKNHDFVFMGEHAAYWKLYFGWGLLVAVLLLTLSVTLWILADISDLTTRRKQVSAITGLLSATCLGGAFLSFRFFYVPPFVFFSLTFGALIAATVLLLKQSIK